jgi:outer membrane protein assembly factor BamB
VADGKVFTLGVRGVFNCYDAASGKKLWHKEPSGNAWPRFFTSSSPIVVDGLCVAQLGGEREGGIVAYDINTGDERWSWNGDGPAYASPALLTIDGENTIVAVTASKLVAINAADGKSLWQIPYTQGRYNAATPIINGTTMIFAGPTKGLTAVNFERKGDALTVSDKWKGPDTSLMFNTPVLRDGWLFGISNLNTLFCASAETGETTWTAPIGDQPAVTPPPTSPPATTPPPAAQVSGEGSGSSSTSGGGAPSAGSTSTPPAAAAQAGGNPPAGGPPGGGRGRGMRGGGGPQGYGSVVDLGSVLVGLNPSGKLVFFEPNSKDYKEFATYRVADGNTYAYPVVSGNRIFIKDKNAVTLWTLE